MRQRVRQGEADAGKRAGTTTEESAEVKRLKRENAELKRIHTGALPRGGRSRRWRSPLVRMPRYWRPGAREI